MARVIDVVSSCCFITFGSEKLTLFDYSYISEALFIGFAINIEK